MTVTGIGLTYIYMSTKPSKHDKSTHYFEKCWCNYWPVQSAFLTYGKEVYGNQYMKIHDDNVWY